MPRYGAYHVAPTYRGGRILYVVKRNNVELSGETSYGRAIAKARKLHRAEVAAGKVARSARQFGVRGLKLGARAGISFLKYALASERRQKKMMRSFLDERRRKVKQELKKREKKLLKEIYS